MPYADKEKQKFYQVEYQKGYREKNKEKARTALNKWKKENTTNTNKENSGQLLTHKDIKLCTDKTNGKYTYKIIYLAKKLGRTYNAIAKIRQRYKEYDRQK